MRRLRRTAWLALVFAGIVGRAATASAEELAAALPDIFDGETAAVGVAAEAGDPAVFAGEAAVASEDMADSRAQGFESPLPASGEIGPMAVILWDELRKGGAGQDTAHQTSGFAESTITVSHN